MAKKFNTTYTSQVLNDVATERLHQVELGKSGKIPHACEDIATHWGYRLGVLGEEYGEVCTEVIECPSNQTPGPNMYHELIQVAAVAVACAESIMATGPMPGSEAAWEGGLRPRAGVDYSAGREFQQAEYMARVGRMKRDSGFGNIDVEGVDWQQEGGSGSLNVEFHKTPEFDTNTDLSEHEQVLLKALAVYKERNAKYKGAWKEGGWRFSLTQIRGRIDRAWQLWNADPRHNETVKTDDLIDLINLAVFAIRNIEAGNRDGTWPW